MSLGAAILVGLVMLAAILCTVRLREMRKAEESRLRGLDQARKGQQTAIPSDIISTCLKCGDTTELSPIIKKDLPTIKIPLVCQICKTPDPYIHVDPENTAKNIGTINLESNEILTEEDAE